MSGTEADAGAWAALVGAGPDAPGAHAWRPYAVARAELDALVRTEWRLFEALGRIAADDPDPMVRALVAVHSRLHGSHARLLVDEAGIVSLPPSGDPPASASFEAFEALQGSLERLGALARVVMPRLVASWARFLVGGDPVAEGPVLRVARWVWREEVECWQAAELAFEACLARTAEPDVALGGVLERVRGLEAPLACALGLGGPGGSPPCLGEPRR
jgi:hypothetical protein